MGSAGFNSSCKNKKQKQKNPVAFPTASNFAPWLAEFHALRLS